MFDRRSHTYATFYYIQIYIIKKSRFDIQQMYKCNNHRCVYVNWTIPSLRNNCTIAMTKHAVISREEDASYLQQLIIVRIF